MDDAERLALILSKPRAFVMVHPDTFPAFLECFRSDGATINDVSHLRVYTSPVVPPGSIYAMDPDAMTPSPRLDLVDDPATEDRTEDAREVIDTWQTPD